MVRCCGPSFREQEDPGNNPHLARIVASSGIIDASRFLGKGSFLFDAQVHSGHPEPDKVERGQLLTLQVRDWKKVFDE